MAATRDKEGFLVIFKELNHLLYIRVTAKGKHFCFSAQAIIFGFVGCELFEEFNGHLGASLEVLAED